MKARNIRDRLLHRRVRAFEKALPEASNGDVNAVHKARVASRRVREALPVVVANLPAKKAKRLARGFRRITRALGPVRGIDVTLRALETVVEQFPDAAASLATVARDLMTERETRRQDMLGRLEHAEPERLVAKLDRVADLGSSQPPVVAQSVAAPCWPFASCAACAVCSRPSPTPARSMRPNRCTVCGSRRRSCGMRWNWRTSSGCCGRAGRYGSWK